MNQLTVRPEPSGVPMGEVSIAAGVGGASIAPQNLGEVVRFAEVMCRADIALPKHLRGNAGACMAVALQALEWRMSPFAVASKSYSVNGMIAYEAQLIAAVVNTRSGIKGRLRYEFIGEGKNLSCKVTGDLDGQECSYETPPFEAIQPKNSPLWKTDPRQQLGYFAARSWARRHCPEVLLGVYDRDEAEHFGPDDAKNVTPAKPTLMTRLGATAGEPASAREGFSASHVASEAATLTGEPAIEHEPASVPSPSPGSAVESMGNPAVPSGVHVSRSDGAVVPLTDPVAASLSADEAEQPAHAAAEPTGADGIEAADGPSAPSAPVVLPKDRAELIDKLLRLAGDAKAIPDTDERQRAIAEAADGWLGSLGDHAKPLVKAVYETARKVAKGELKADAARKYLEGLPS